MSIPLHNAAHKASKKIGVVSGFDVEKIAVDIYYYFSWALRHGTVHFSLKYAVLYCLRMVKHRSYDNYLAAELQVLDLINTMAH